MQSTTVYRKKGFYVMILVLIVIMQLSVFADITIKKKQNISLKNEIQHAIQKGLTWLKENQNTEGYWSQKEYPALTALVLYAFMSDPEQRYTLENSEFIKSGYDYLISCVQDDGGIYVNDLSTYNTAVSIMALVTAGSSRYKDIILQARNYLVSLQSDYNQQGVNDSQFNGGIGYGSRYEHSDMSNTVLAMEAIHYTKFLKQDHPELKELDFESAIQFMQRCQNLPEYNDQPWATGDSLNKGGFVYFPGNSKAGEMELASGKKTLRSYGSMSYAGLLSYIYADLEVTDPRVQAVYDWLRQNYTLAENPGMGKQGLFYYYHTMAKALNIIDKDKIELTGKKNLLYSSLICRMVRDIG